MASFNYTAKTKAGAIQKGSLVAADQPAAAATLIDRGLVPVVIKAEAASRGGKGLISKLGLKGGVKLQDKVIFSRQFATMINAGVPIVQALGILQLQTVNKHFQVVIADLAKQVEGGSTLSGALAEHSEIFSPTYVNMVKAGEAGGLLDDVLERLAVQQEKDAEVVGKVRSAMIYPAILLSVTVGAFTFLMVYLVPHLVPIFAQLGVALPWYSKLMLVMSNFFVHFGLYLLGALVAAGVVGFRSSHTPKGKRFLDRLIVRLPIFGTIIVKMNVARFARTFGSLMAAGLSVLDALNTTADSLGNSVFQDSLHEVAEQVKAGKPISVPLKTMKVFPPIVVQMIAVGEETGKLDDILLKLAGFYEREVDTVIAGLTAVVEPILIVALGGVVGFVVIGVYGPLAALNGSVGN
jgi:type IV pilus assembly protein PilC